MPATRSPHPHQDRRIVILGGGYAALGAVSTLSALAPESGVTLIAPRKAHIKITHLHETLRYSLRRLCILYEDLAERFGFHFIQGKLRFDTDSLLRWQQRRVIRLDGREIPFDGLIVATGADYGGTHNPTRVLTVHDFCLNRGQTMVRDLCKQGGKTAELSVVGGGATGMQFLFELSSYLKRKGRRGWKLRLINYEQRVLGQFPDCFYHYALERMLRESIEYFPSSAFLRQEDDVMVIRRRDGNDEYRLPSQLTLLFPGVKPTPVPIMTNRFGQVLAKGEILDRIFAAGDCARFEGAGANTLSAQVALRKGKAVASNLLCRAAGQEMRPYVYAEHGYFVSLGPNDGIGWLETKENILTGHSAAVIKTAIEKQYDLLLAGIDTYAP